MAAAWDLTSPDNPDQCDVTIFQMGGRLGGKGASSRNPQHANRIEEHGLHVWLGYYENAFRMIRTCFTELRERGELIDLEGRRPRGGRYPNQQLSLELNAYFSAKPFNNWDWLSAFERASLVGLGDDSSGDW